MHFTAESEIKVHFARHVLKNAATVAVLLGYVVSIIGKIIPGLVQSGESKTAQKALLMGRHSILSTVWHDHDRRFQNLLIREEVRCGDDAIELHCKQEYGELQSLPLSFR
jgi:hypothetical protein